MPLPNLIHPLTVTIEPLNRAGTVYDREAREPVRTVRRSTTVSIQAQVTYRSNIAPETLPEGLAEVVGGYLLFRSVDLTAAGYTPHPGDRITAIGNHATSLFLLQRENSGHYPDQNGASLVLAYFGDRRPSADAPNMVA